MISTATDHGSSATIQTDDPASRGGAPDARPVSAANIRLANPERAAACGGLRNAAATLIVLTALTLAAPVEAQTNATGQPSISGQPLKGAVLTAGSGSIADPDGTTGATFTYTWLRCDSNGNNCDTEAGTGGTYTLMSHDVGKRFRLRANFTDDAGNSESRRGFPWPSRSVDTIYDYLACGTPDFDNLSRGVVWTGTVTVGHRAASNNVDFYGWLNGSGGTPTTGSFSGSTSHTHGTETHNFEFIHVSTVDRTSHRLNTYHANAVSASAFQSSADLQFHVCDKKTLNFSAATHVGVRFYWDVDFGFLEGTTRTLYITEARNSSTGTLSTLTLSAGTLTPAFSSDTVSYAALVDSNVSRITVTPSTTHPRATVAYFDASDNALTDADTSSTATFEVDLSSGTNVVKVKVTAEDTTTAKTYTVTVTRGALTLSAPTSFMAAPDNTQVTLSWAAPLSDGGAAVTGYEYRHAAGTTVPTSTTWTAVPDGSDSGVSTADETGVTISSLTNGTEYAFEVRAVNSGGQGAKAGPVTATPTNCVVPNFGTRRNIWTGNVTVGFFMSAVNAYGYVLSPFTGNLDDRNLSIGSNDYLIDSILVWSTSSNAGDIRFGFRSDLTSAEKTALRLHVCDAPYDFSTANHASGHSYDFSASLDWSGLSSRTLHLSLPANNPATGKAAISGTTTLGSMLTAGKGTIADVDGVPAESTFTYQWVRVDGATETDISRATLSSYTLVAGDVGKQFKVKVSFTDDFGSAEERTSGVHPASVPGAPQNLEAVAGDTQVTLSWAAPASDGGAAITQYEYRHAAGTTVSTSTDWTAVPDGSDSGASTADETGVTITSLSNGTQYAFEVRAVNSGGGGTKAGPVTATPAAANAAPAFANDSEARSFTETVGDEAVATAGDVGAAVTATDGDGDTLTYALEGADAAKFGIVSTSGQIQTKAGEKYDREAKASYSVTVKASDAMGGSDTVPVTITADNAVEKPVAPGAPTVSATSGVATSLDVSWTAPANTGRPALSGYKLRYRTGSGAWTDQAHSGTGTTATIASLTASTDYEVQVRAVNADGDGDWSASGTGMTGSPPNNAPEFSDTAAARSFTETVGNATETAARNVGTAVTATDTDGDTLTYSLEGADAAKFGIVSTGGRIQTKAGEKYDREAKASYSVTVKASDPNGGSDTIAVTITVDNAVEKPVAPGAPTVTVTSGSTTSLDVSWTAPANTGRPALSGYKLRYRTGSGAWTDHAHSGTGTTATIASLTASTAYEVQVRAVNADGDGDWSASGTGTTGSPSNNAPEFSDTAAARSFTETVGNATETAARNVGAAVTATDADGDTLTYSLEGADAAKFGIVSTSGRIRTKAGERYDREAKASYSVTVKASDPNGGSDTIAVTITVDNAVEKPVAPGAPTVSATSGSTTSLDVSWTAPANTGRPALSDYKVRYRAGNGNWTDRSHTGLGTGTTIASLTASTTYEVQVRAVNADGDGAWSGSGSGTTGTDRLPGAPGGLTARGGDAAVTLSWTAPGSDGGAPILKYRYRYAAGSTVPSGVSWRDVPDSADAGASTADETGVTVTRLFNETQYAFEVQAVNSAGGGAKAGPAKATPRAQAAQEQAAQSLPTAPRGLRGDGSLYVEGNRFYSSVTERAQVKLSWDAPSNLGNSPLVRYEYRYAARGESLSSAVWNHGPASERTLTVRNLVAGTTYTFQLRAVTLAGAGRAASVGVTTPRSERLSLSVFTRGLAVEGENLTIGVRRSGRPASDEEVLLVVVEIYDSTLSTYTHKSVDIASGALEGTATFRVPFDGERGASRELEVTLHPGSWVLDRVPEGVNPATYRVGSPASATVRVSNRDALLRVRDATVREGPQAVLRFDVSLDRAAAGPVTVDYATSDVTATADYTATSDTLTFAAGEISKTVSVAVLDDAHDEGTETLTLTLSNARGAAIDDGTATGRIINTDPMPKAWMARFGRTASDHVIQAIESRLQGEASAQTQSHLTIAGRRVDTLFERGRYAAAIDALTDTPDPRLEPETVGARMDRLKAEALGPADSNPAGGSLAGVSLSGSGSAPRSGPAGSSYAGSGAGRRLAGLLGLPDLEGGLMGSSFLYSRPADGGDAPAWLGRWTAWGQTAETRFDGADGPLSVHGEVATATVGVDTRRERWLAGVAVSYSLGDGAYTQAQAGGGTLASTLASVSPFARFELNERTSLWGVFGHGAGRLSLRPDRAAAAMETDLTNTMTAFGARTALSALAGRAGRFELSLVSDARMTSTVSDTVAGLMGATGETSRVRLLLEGAGSMRLATGGALTPTLEAGLRYDGGDAETGAGVEIGAGLGYTAGRFAVQANARGLVAHEDAGYEEWGFSGAVRYRAADDGRGVSFDLGSAWGAAQSGVEGLWNRQNASGLARGVAPDAAQRLQANLGYGVQGRKGRALWVPYVGVESGEGGSQALQLGLNLASGPNVEAGLEFGRRDGGIRAAGQAPERAMQLRWGLRW